MNSKRINIPLPDELKERLDQMAEEVGMSVSQLVVLSIHSLVANYEAKGSFIFADLLNPDHRGTSLKMKK